MVSATSTAARAAAYVPGRMYVYVSNAQGPARPSGRRASPPKRGDRPSVAARFGIVSGARKSYG